LPNLQSNLLGWLDWLRNGVLVFRHVQAVGIGVYTQDDYSIEENDGFAAWGCIS
jgi:hypothetical protein